MRAIRSSHKIRFDDGECAASLRMRPDMGTEPKQEFGLNPALSPMSDLDLMIQNGWGDTVQERLPKDWRTRRNPRGKMKI